MGFWSNVDRPTMRYEIFRYTPERGTMEMVRGKSIKGNKKLRRLQTKILPSLLGPALGEDREKKRNLFVRGME